MMNGSRKHFLFSVYVVFVTAKRCMQKLAVFLCCFSCSTVTVFTIQPELNE